MFGSVVCGMLLITHCFGINNCDLLRGECFFANGKPASQSQFLEEAFVFKFMHYK